MFSSILGWSCQLYVALEFCSVLHITYYTAVLQQLYCIVLQVLLGSSTHQDSIPHSETLIASSLQANKYYWWFEGRKLSFWIRITITNTNPIFNLILQSCVRCQNQWLLTEFWDQFSYEPSQLWSHKGFLNKNPIYLKFQNFVSRHFLFAKRDFFDNPIVKIPIFKPFRNSLGHSVRFI